jgi:hypothetical protein
LEASQNDTRVTPPDTSPAGGDTRLEDLPSPKAAISRTSYKFGTVLDGDTVKHDYVIRNKGDAVLHIKKVRTG